MLSLAFATNEPRSRFLLAELERLADVVTEIDFDQIDPLTKYAAALLSYRRPRSEWWDAYQMHPLLQSRRRKVLARALHGPTAAVDALLMWGSWFHPFRDRVPNAVPFFNYIDQSHSLTANFGEPAASPHGRARAHRLQAETYRDSSGILCMSQWARAQTLAAHAVLSDKVHVVGWGPCGVDLSNEHIPESAREPLILHVSNSFHRKGVDFLLATARLVAAMDPTARFVVVGKDAENMVVQDTATVTFVGPVTDRAVLADYFRRARVFFMPHRFDRSPHALVEAMSAGLPVVTSAQGGSIELVEGSGAGRCVPIGDVAGYAEAIVALLRDPDARGRAGANGRTAVRRTYNWPAVARHILEVVTHATHHEGVRA
jgi:glycosyltransferase involved in cell wall biosynthesis